MSGLQTEELIRLPARLRMPLLKCCLEAATQEEAAWKLAGRWRLSSDGWYGAARFFKQD